MAKRQTEDNEPKFRSVAELREYYRSVLLETVPERLQKLVEKLKEMEKTR